MARTEKPRGSRALEIRDWPFGSRGRRLFLEAVLLGDAPPGGWTKVELERAAEVERGGVDRLLAGAGAIGLVRWEAGRWHLCEPAPNLAGPLGELVRISGDLPAAGIDDLPRRGYRKGG